MRCQSHFLMLRLFQQRLDRVAGTFLLLLPNSVQNNKIGSKSPRSDTVKSSMSPNAWSPVPDRVRPYVTVIS